MNLLKEELSKILNEIVVEMVNNITIYFRPSYRIINLTDNSYQIEGYNKPDYFLSLHVKPNPIFSEYNYSSIDSIINNHYPFFLNDFKTRFGSCRVRKERIIEVLLVNLLSRGIDKTNYKDKIAQVIEDFIILIEKKKIHLNVYIPIKNLLLDENIEYIDFGNGFSVRKLSEAEIEMLYLDKGYDPSLIDICRYSIVFNTDENIIYDNSLINMRSGDEYLDNEINKIIYSLNITSKGSLGYETKSYFYDDIFKYFFSNRSTGSLKRIIGTAPKLDDSLVAKWKNYYNILSIIDYSPFQLALKKLQEAETRLAPEDSIIDSVIGLESLLLNDIGNETTRGEMKYRFCINYAILFEDEKKEEVFHTAAADYDLRSLIVHGGKIDKDKLKFGKTFIHISNAKEMILEMLRICLQLLLNTPINMNFNSRGFWLKKVLHNNKH